MSAGYSSGIFESKPSEILECSICLEVFKDPLQCLNGHLFCKTCITESLERISTCPICKITLIVGSLSPCLIAQKMVESLTTYCISREMDDEVSKCEWKGPLHDRQRHFATECEYFMVKCKNVGCEIQLPRKSISEHNKVCLFAVVNCEDCTETVARGDLIFHKSICEYRPILCPNNCSVVVSFNHLQTHLQNECLITNSVSTSKLGDDSLIHFETAAERNHLQSSKCRRKNAKKADKRKNSKLALDNNRNELHTTAPSPLCKRCITSNSRLAIAYSPLHGMKYDYKTTHRYYF